MAKRDHHDRPPFTRWAEERLREPMRFDNARLDQVPIREKRDGQPATSPELAWNARRRHAPCHERVPDTCRVDCHYLRLDEEYEYVIRLSHILSVPGYNSLDRASWVFLAFVPPFIPFRWPSLPRPTPFPRQEFASEGEIQVAGEPFARDSAYALYEASLAANAGDPGRFVAEFRKEARLRAKGLLVSWAQVEFHQIFPAHREALYPGLPHDWAHWEIPEKMAVPLPPVLTYAGSRLIRGDRLAWAVFFTEWTVLVFGRWVADAFHRGLLWRLPQRVLNGIRDLGPGELLRSTAYTVKDVDVLLEIHGGVDWGHRSLASARVGAVPVTRDGGVFTTVRESDLPRVGDRQMEEEETVVAEGRWDDDIGLFDRAPRGTHLRSAPVPESRLPTCEASPGMGSTVCNLDPRTPLASRRDSFRAADMAAASSSPRGVRTLAANVGPGTSAFHETSPMRGLAVAPPEKDTLRASKITEWMWRLDIHYALDNYFPRTGMTEEDLARAYALLLVERDQARNRLAGVEGDLREERLDRRQLSVLRDRAVDHLHQVQDDLNELMGRLSLKGGGDDLGYDSQGSAGFGNDDGRRKW